MDLTPQVLKDVEFREKFRGYDPDEVDAFLEQVGTAIGQLQSRLKAALEQAQAAGRSQPPAQTPSEPGRLHDPDGALQRVLLAAQETADKVVHDAEAEAATMLADAEQKSSSLMTDAEEHSEKVRTAASAEARRALEEARAPLMTEIADLRTDRERLHGEVTALERYLDTERADAIATLERLQSVLAEPDALRMTESPVRESGDDPAPGFGDDDADTDDGGSAFGGAAPAGDFAPPEPERAESPPPEPAPAPPLPPQGSLAEPSAVTVEPDDPDQGARAQAEDVVVDLVAEAQPAVAPAMAGSGEELPWAEGGEVIHGAFAPEPAADEAPLDLVDPDGGPPTEAYMNLFNEGGEESGDRFLDELRRAVDDEDDALGTPDEEADAAMAAFFDQDEEDPNSGRR